MEKTLARLTVVISDEPEGLSSNLTFPKNGNPDYSLIIKPLVDKTILAGVKEPLNMENLQTILAHELGHFIANVLKDRTHDKLSLILRDITGDSRMVLPAEEKAWNLAHTIFPQLNTKIENYALEGYRSNGANGAVSEDN